MHDPAGSGQFLVDDLAGKGFLGGHEILWWGWSYYNFWFNWQQTGASYSIGNFISHKTAPLFGS